MSRVIPSGTNGRPPQDNSMRYDAFISYRRTERDVAVAKEIQSSLEHFRVPKGIRSTSGKEKIDRIFRDQEELEITSDLSRRIEDALRASEYLIVICSPGYKQSVWCLHELETFLELRGPEHVLCVLSEGEPPDVFPDLLRHGREEVTAEDGTKITVETEIEPLACDYRGDFKAARKTELPRLAAVLLGCRYDELVMRRERYRRRRLAAFFSAGFTAAAAAITWLIWSNAQISKNYRQSLISESRLLAMKSLDAFDTQDRLQSLNDALQALTGETEDRPVTDEAQYAIAQATYAYDTAYQWLETWRIDDVNDITEYFISRDRSCIVCMDRTGRFRSFELSTHRELCTFRATDQAVPSSPVEGRDGDLLCYDGAAVVSVNYRNGAVNWRLPLQYQALGGIQLSHDGAFAAAKDSYAVQILTTDGVPHLSMPLPEDAPGYITELCWSQDDSKIAVMLKNPESTGYRIGVFDTESSDFTLTAPEYLHVDLFQFDEDGILYLLGHNDENGSSAVGKTTTLIPARYELTAFQNGELLWQRQITEKTLCDRTSLQIRRLPEKQLILALGSSIRSYDAAGMELGSADVRKDILNLQPAETEAINYITQDGELGTTALSNGSSLMIRIFPKGLERVSTVRGEDSSTIRYIAFADGNLGIYESVYDDDLRFFEGEGSRNSPDGFLRDGKRLLQMSDRVLRLYDLEEKKQDGTVELSREDAWHLLTTQNNIAWLLRIAGEDGAYSLLGVDMMTGEAVREESLTGADWFVAGPVMNGPLTQAEAMYLDYFYTGPAPVAVWEDRVFYHDAEECNKLRIYSLSDGNTEELDLTQTLGGKRRLLYESSGFSVPAPLSVSPDGKTLFTACTDTEENGCSAVLIRLEDGHVTILPGTPDDLSSVAFTENGVIYAGMRKIWFCSFDGELQNMISFSGDTPVSFAWHRGRLYCVFPDSTLRIYENGDVIRSIPLSFELSFDVMNGKAFRYEFSDTRLYLYCGGAMNTVMLNSEGETAVYYAGSVLAHLEDRQELLVYSLDREKLEKDGDRNLYLGYFREYSVDELIERARQQLEHYEPEAAETKTA